MKKSKSRKRKPAALPPAQTSAIVKAQQVQEQALSVPESIEKVLILGDLASLQPQDRIDYYNRVCRSLGLNPLTMPFSYILFREFDGGPAKLSLYANKSCTEQLRKIHGVSIIPPMRRSKGSDTMTVECDVRDRTGRTDSASGSVALFKYKDGKRIDFTGKELCNAEMKCETKAKRRATLSICGLAFLDESELDTMEVVGGVTRDGRIYYHEGEEPGVHRGGSKEAQQRVLEEKLAGNGTKPVEAEIVEPEPPAQEARPSKGSVRIDMTNPQDPLLMGDITDLVPIPGDTSGKHAPLRAIGVELRDGLWHIYPAGQVIEQVKQVCEAEGYTVEMILPQKGSGATKETPAKKTSTASGKAAGIQSTTEPVLVTGTIERINTAMAGKAPVKYVTLLMADKKKPSYGCFDKKLFDFIDKGQGKLATFIIETHGKYTNITGAKKIGSIEFEDGCVPVIRTDREPGTPKLF